MAAVYSVVFAQLHAFSGAEQFAVPDGEVWVIRDVGILVYGDLIPASYYLSEYESHTTFVWTVSPGEAASGFYHWSGRQVLTPGMVLNCATEGEGDFRVCGYSLTLP